MPYVFDTSAFIIIGHYYPDQFPTFWDYRQKTDRKIPVVVLDRADRPS